MKYKEGYVGTRKECIGFMGELFTKLFKGQLTVEDVQVEIPEDKELDYKVKYENDEMEGQLAVKISWMNAEIEEEEEPEEQEEEED
ncbi:MAG: hypothetical protein HPY66_3057 [Firmicutes bacterium]|nr:hypothetical protein [Bacillota bacterium]MDI6707335.1 transcription initiation factor IIE [Bacillota bacterium]